MKRLLKYPVSGFLLLILLFSCQALRGDNEPKLSTDQYIANFKDIAIREMKLTGMPASIILAQGILESSNGNSDLARKAHNHFGIKCRTEWTGGRFYIDDDAPNECFRVYATDEDSYIDHSAFLVMNSRYAFLFELKPSDYEGWAKGLKKAGYATNPEYPNLLINTIKKYNLDQYDKDNKQVASDERIKNVTQQRQEIAADNKVSSNTINKQDNKPKERGTAPNIATNELIYYNKILAYEVKTGESYISIAEKLQLMRWQVRKYNDLKKSDVLEPGTLVYLKPKHRKGKTETYTVLEGESMYYISQLVGIKLKRLYKLNRMHKGEEAAPGEVLNLKHSRTAPPKLVSLDAKAKRKGLKLEHKNDPEKKDNTSSKAKTNSDSNPKAGNSTTVDTKAQQLLFDSSSDYHTVATTETIYDIAAKYHVTINELKAWNNMSDLSIKPGEEIRIKKPDNNNSNTRLKNGKLPDPPQTSNNGQGIINKDGIYTVDKGETLYSISRKTGVSVNELREINHLKDYSVNVGQQLILKKDKADDGKTQNYNTKQGDNNGDYHTVVAGETMYSICKLFNISLDKLKALNNLKDNSLTIGQKLKVKE